MWRNVISFQTFAWFFWLVYSLGAWRLTRRNSGGHTGSVGSRWGWWEHHPHLNNVSLTSLNKKQINTNVYDMHRDNGKFSVRTRVFAVIPEWPSGVMMTPIYLWLIITELKTLLWQRAATRLWSHVSRERQEPLSYLLLPFNFFQRNIW